MILFFGPERLEIGGRIGYLAQELNAVWITKEYLN